MKNLEELKNAILSQKETNQFIEECYKDFLNNPTCSEINIFINMLNMVEKNDRITEILKVMNLVRFPINKSQN